MADVEDVMRSKEIRPVSWMAFGEPLESCSGVILDSFPTGHQDDPCFVFQVLGFTGINKGEVWP